MSGRRRGKRGKHRSPRRPLSASVEEWETWDAAAAKHWPFTFAEWARRVLNAAALDELGADTRADTRARAPKGAPNAHARELAGLKSSHRHGADGKLYRVDPKHPLRLLPGEVKGK